MLSSPHGQEVQLAAAAPVWVAPGANGSVHAPRSTGTGGHHGGPGARRAGGGLEGAGSPPRGEQSATGRDESPTSS